ncbi:MAG: hypothetical protein JWM05_853 [Acidimicrobiales bacterium]|nr:hypothetical protein [Acidimicrobiales bacterium]
MADQCTTTDDPPPPEPPPPPIHTSYDLWNPGGDPGALRQAATAWRALADALRATAGDIDAGATELSHSWHGQAQRAFATYWGDLHGSLLEGADHADDVAGTLDKIAGEIERVNHEVHELYVAVAATVAVSLAASIFTFGASTAAGAAATAAAVARATTLVDGLIEFLSAIRVGFTITRFVRFWKLWTIAAGVNTAAVGVVKLGQGQNPFDPDSWSARDLSGIIVNADAGVVANGLLGPGIAAGATGAAGGSVASDVWLDDRDIFSGRVGLDALISGATGGAATAAASKGIDALRNAGRPQIGPALTPEPIIVRGSGTATSIDDLYLPGRPPPAGPAPAPQPAGPILYLPGQVHPHVIEPGHPVPPAAVATIDSTGNLVGSATGTMGTWPFYGNGAATPTHVCLPPPPVLAGAH